VEGLLLVSVNGEGWDRWGVGQEGVNGIHVYIHCVGEEPLWAVAPHTHLPDERVGSILICGGCVSGRDEVRTLGGGWRCSAYCHRLLFSTLGQTLEFRRVVPGYKGSI
jgi:hypothetical protein